MSAQLGQAGLKPFQITHIELGTIRNARREVENESGQTTNFCGRPASAPPASVWVKAGRLHTLIPRGTERWKSLYHQHGAVEREFGVLKHQWAMLPLGVRLLPPREAAC